MMTYFRQWREWNKTRALDFCIQSFQHADSVRNSCKAEILAAILFQRCDYQNPQDKERIEAILPKAVIKLNHEVESIDYTKACSSFFFNIKNNVFVFNLKRLKFK